MKLSSVLWRPGAKATEKHNKRGLNAASYTCPLKLGTVSTVHCFNSHDKQQRGEEKKGQSKDHDRILPTDQSSVPTEGCCGAPCQTESGAGKIRRKQSKWAVRGGPSLSAAAGLAQPPNALGEPGATVLMNVNEDGGDFRRCLAALRKMPGTRAPQATADPGSGHGTCPGERRQEPFV